MLAVADRFIVSAQCLAEFYRATTLRLPERLSPATALAQVGRFARMGPVLDVTSSVVLEACRGSIEHRLSIWDALVWAAAKMNAVPYVLTEDAEHERVLEGVTYLDPFDPRFELDSLVS